MLAGIELDTRRSHSPRFKCILYEHICELVMCSAVNMWLLIYLLCIWNCVQTVRIENVRVPEVIMNGTEQVVLDCDYIIKNVSGLVVKWFYNNYSDDNQLVYQWIPLQKPQALGTLKNKLDLSYKVSDDVYTSHRALRILSPSPELTGNYTCVVSTFLSEDRRTRPMTIFVPETKFDMIQDRLSDGSLDIICHVEGVFPEPKLTILAANRPLNAKSWVRKVNGKYTATTSIIIDVDTLPSTAELLCDMQVPLANYYSRKRQIFFRDPPATSPEPAKSNGHRTPNKGLSNAGKPIIITIISILSSISGYYNILTPGSCGA